MGAVTTFDIVPRGPFSLEAARTFAGGFAATSAAARRRPTGSSWPSRRRLDRQRRREVREAGGTITVSYATVGNPDDDALRLQVARCLSLDHDGTGWPDVGKRDPVISRLQERHDYLRPVCFYSAYEAATSFVIGQRIARRQAARVKAWLGEQLGDRVELDGANHVAFPRPQRLLELTDAPGLNATKVERFTGWPKPRWTAGSTPSGYGRSRPRRPSRS
jgi:DNA-3-methyladenine glycosylase II